MIRRSVAPSWIVVSKQRRTFHPRTPSAAPAALCSSATDACFTASSRPFFALSLGCPRTFLRTVVQQKKVVGHGPGDWVDRSTPLDVCKKGALCVEPDPDWRLHPSERRACTLITDIEQAAGIAQTDEARGECHVTCSLHTATRAYRRSFTLGTSRSRRSQPRCEQTAGENKDASATDVGSKAGTRLAKEGIYGNKYRAHHGAFSSPRLGERQAPSWQQSAASLTQIGVK